MRSQVYSKLILFVAILFSHSLFAAPNCTNEALKVFLKMDYKSFDQSPPDGGWRMLQDKGKDMELATLLDGYVSCRPGLTSDQKATLIFHAGQIYADMGQTKMAIARFKKSFNKNLDAQYHWNSYVQGTLGFVEKNMKKIKSARAQILKKEKDHPYVQTLDNLILCFGKPYKDVGSCAKASRKNAAPPSTQEGGRQ